MTRLDGWEQRFLSALDEVRRWDYKLGETDCAAMVCLFIRALTGEDFWPRLKGRYDCESGAALVLASEAYATRPYLLNAVSNILGGAPSGIREAQRGDPVVWRVDGELHLGVLLHTQILGFGPDGIFYVPVSEGECCWRIG